MLLVWKCKTIAHVIDQAGDNLVLCTMSRLVLRRFAHVARDIDVKTFFIQGTFLRFLTFFYFPTFLFLKTFIENTIWNHFRNNGSKLGLYDVFLCTHVRISISTYILTSIVIYLPYRLTSSDATRRCVFVYVGKLVGWKTWTFFIQRLQTVFFILVTFLRFLTLFNFFSGTFFTSMARDTIDSPVLDCKNSVCQTFAATVLYIFKMFLLTFLCVYFYVCILLCAASGEWMSSYP